ncbi:MAG: fasciclin domain-containing protein [Brevundimonas sp.]|uniref:fasciclin domain-containing protein n=1 Tax=Brevundimonas sp. TaxID=1871086 RepID=UPI002ABA013A|nr:fasciclin domain-containing protein [Brevundimonas sp.]MDZ4111360.1 fasciclin domain-containing protein [Brevundimonas sp.]
MLRTSLLAAAAATLLAAPPAIAQTADQTAAPAAQAAASAQTPAAAENVIEVLKMHGRFTTLLQALDQAQLTETLATRPAITLFAPTDEAFAALPEAERTRLLDPANAQELRNLLLYHVLVTDLTTSQISGARGPISTAGGVEVTIDGTGDAITVADATVTEAEIDAANGGIFVLDKVLSPDAAAQGDAEVEAAATPAPTTGVNAPNGEPAAAVTTTASPPVQNPTDGQVDQVEDPANPAPTPN